MSLEVPQPKSAAPARTIHAQRTGNDETSECECMLFSTRSRGARGHVTMNVVGGPAAQERRAGEDYPRAADRKRRNFGLRVHAVLHAPEYTFSNTATIGFAEVCLGRAVPSERWPAVPRVSSDQ